MLFAAPDLSGQVHFDLGVLRLWRDPIAAAVAPHQQAWVSGYSAPISSCKREGIGVSSPPFPAFKLHPSNSP
jgi:hypothetical protein